MCGIAGYLGKKSISDEVADSCLKLMGRRGPDACGVYRDVSPSGENVLLLHSRLSIIDLDERANQPFEFENKVLSFNGEIYNYIEVRDALKKSGCTFQTESDTEVLIEGFVKKEKSAFDMLEGMWAFALYDKNKGELLLSRDRFGEKPLFILEDDSGIYFASEIKFIFELAGKSPEINEHHLIRYMVNGYKSLYKYPDTFFDGIQEVEPGTYVQYSSSKKCKKERYWNFAFNPDEALSYQDAVDETRALLLNSMKLRLRSDVPMAFCMSGGIDSNSLICSAKRKYNYDVHGFTIVNKDSRYEENKEVEHVVKELGLKHTSVKITPDNFLDNLRELVRQHDAPVYTISYYVQWLLMKEIHNSGYKVSVSGTAADEIFSGYYDHNNLYLAEMYRLDSDKHAAALKNWETYTKPIVRNPYLQDADIFVNNPDERRHIYLNNDHFAGYLNREWQEDFMEQKYCDSVMRNRMLNEMFHEAVPVILHEDDSNAMYYSIENRSPFLDRNLFEFSLKIPTEFLIQNGYTKSILREAMRGIVPDEILDNRRKVGFNAPVFSFLNINDTNVKSYLLDNSPIYNLIRKEKIEKLLAKDELPNSESKFLFYFVCSKMFMEQFN